MTRYLWNEPVVIVPGHMAGPLGKILGEALAKARRDGQRDLEEFEQLMRSLMAAALSASKSSTTSVSDDGNSVHAASASGELTVVEASAVLGLGRRRICQLLDSGQLAGRRSGGIWLADAASVQARKQRSM